MENQPNHQEHEFSCLQGPEPPLTGHLNTHQGLQDWLLGGQSIQKRQEAEAKGHLSGAVLQELMEVAFPARSIHPSSPFQVLKVTQVTLLWDVLMPELLGNSLLPKSRPPAPTE